MRHTLLLLALLTLAVSAGCTATAPPHDTSGGDPPAQPPTTVEVLRAAQPALDGLALAADNGVELAIRDRESTACLVLSGAASTARTISKAFGGLDPTPGAEPLCAIPGVEVDLSACGDLIVFTPLAPDEAIREVDAILAPSLPAARGVMQTVLALAGTSTEARAWVDAAFVYFDNMRGEAVRYLRKPDGHFKLPDVPVSGCAPPPAAAVADP